MPSFSNSKKVLTPYKHINQTISNKYALIDRQLDQKRKHQNTDSMHQV